MQDVVFSGNELMVFTIGAFIIGVAASAVKQSVIDWRHSRRFRRAVAIRPQPARHWLDRMAAEERIKRNFSNNN